MPSRITPTEIAKAIALRELGHSIADIASETGKSERTIKRVLSDHKVERGSLLRETRREVATSLVNDICSDSQVKAIITALANQVLLHGVQAQSRLQEAANRTGNVETLNDYLKLARAESASALALKANVDTIRSLLAFGERLAPEGDLPVLTVRRLTDQEVEEMRAAQAEEERALGSAVEYPLEQPDVVELE